MNDAVVAFIIYASGWVAISLSRAVSRLDRMATAMERLVSLAERGRK